MRSPSVLNSRVPSLPPTRPRWKNLTKFSFNKYIRDGISLSRNGIAIVQRVREVSSTRRSPCRGDEGRKSWGFELERSGWYGSGDRTMHRSGLPVEQASTRLDSHALAATLRQVRYSIITLYLFCAVQFSRAAQRIVYKKRKICDFRVRL